MGCIVGGFHLVRANIQNLSSIVREIVHCMSGALVLIHRLSCAYDVIIYLYASGRRVWNLNRTFIINYIVWLCYKHQPRVHPEPENGDVAYKNLIIIKSYVYIT